MGATYAVLTGVETYQRFRLRSAPPEGLKLNLPCKLEDSLRIGGSCNLAECRLRCNRGGRIACTGWLNTLKASTSNVKATPSRIGNRR